MLQKWVEHKQAAIKVGGEYEEIEADEVVVRKKSLAQNMVCWHEFVGVKQRGDRQSLILQKRAAEHTVSKRAEPARPGKKGGRAAPPPLKSKEWVAIAKNHVKNKTVLHVDGAQAYAKKVKGIEMRRDTVDHGCRHGGPYYAKKAVRNGLTGQPRGKTKRQLLLEHSLWMDSGVSRSLIFVESRQDEERVDERVRQTQWMHWIGSDDPFAAQGQVLKNVRDLEL